MPPISPELSIGHNLEADSFLQSDRFPDAFVFDCPKSRNLDFPLTRIRSRLVEFGLAYRRLPTCSTWKKSFADCIRLLPEKAFARLKQWSESAFGTSEQKRKCCELSGVHGQTDVKTTARTALEAYASVRSGEFEDLQREV